MLSKQTQFGSCHPYLGEILDPPLQCLQRADKQSKQPLLQCLSLCLGKMWCIATNTHSAFHWFYWSVFHLLCYTLSEIKTYFLKFFWSCCKLLCFTFKESYHMKLTEFSRNKVSHVGIIVKLRREKIGNCNKMNKFQCKFAFVMLL